MPQNMHANLGRGVFPLPQGTSSTTTPLLAVDPSHAVDQKDQVAPEAAEFKPSRRGRLVVARRELMTARANSRGSFRGRTGWGGFAHLQQSWLALKQIPEWDGTGL